MVSIYSVPETLRSKREIILNTRTYLTIDRLPWDKRERHPLYHKIKTTLNLQTSKELELRALCIFDSLISILEGIGGEMKYENSTYVLINGVKVSIRIYEKSKRIENKDSEYSWDKYKTVDSGKLIIKLEQGYKDSAIEDTDYLKLEQKLDKVVWRILKLMQDEIEWKKELKQREIERQKLEEIRRQEEIRLQELAKCKEIEKEEIRKAFITFKRLKLYKEIDNIIKYLNGLATNKNNSNLAMIKNKMYKLSSIVDPLNDSSYKGLLSNAAYLHH